MTDAIHFPLNARLQRKSVQRKQTKTASRTHTNCNDRKFYIFLLTLFPSFGKFVATDECVFICLNACACIKQFIYLRCRLCLSFERVRCAYAYAFVLHVCTLLWHVESNLFSYAYGKMDKCCTPDRNFRS